MFDRVCSAVLLVLLAPLLTLIAALIKLDSRGPVLFRQTSEGAAGLLFTKLKFRTMVHGQPAGKRVTAVGGWLRSLSLDDLPQLLNVLRGEMSLVGPSALWFATPARVRSLDPWGGASRMKPGMTGWAQLHGLHREARSTAHDLYYVENWSMGLDLRIILRTVLPGWFSRSANGS